MKISAALEASTIPLFWISNINLIILKAAIDLDFLLGKAVK